MWCLDIERGQQEIGARAIRADRQWGLTDRQTAQAQLVGPSLVSSHLPPPLFPWKGHLRHLCICPRVLLLQPGAPRGSEAVHPPARATLVLICIQELPSKRCPEHRSWSHSPSRTNCRSGSKHRQWGSVWLFPTQNGLSSQKGAAAGVLCCSQAKRGERAGSGQIPRTGTPERKNQTRQ